MVVVRGRVDLCHVVRVRVPARAVGMSIQLTPTPAMEIGSAFVAQCRQCGVLVYVPHATLQVRHLANCPACDKQLWQQVRPPVGPFKSTDDAA